MTKKDFNKNMDTLMIELNKQPPAAKHDKKEGTEKQKPYVRYALDIDTDNVQYIEDLKRITGKSKREILNLILNEDRERRQSAVMEAMKNLKKSENII